MKKILFSVILTMFGIVTLAQVPEFFSYQAVVRDETNNPITDQSVSFRISILKGDVSGSEEYVETHTTSTNSIGLVNLVIGNGTDKTGTISGIDWGTDSYFLKVEIDPTGGTSYSEMGTTQLLSVPYAMHAKTAESVKTYSVGDFAQGGVVFYVDETGQHGLACAIEDQGGSGIQWNSSTSTTSAVGDGVYAGEMNTLLIMVNGAVSINYAPHVCIAYNVTQNSVIYGDWYLPSKYELNLMYNNKTTINTTATANGGSSFASAYYWSSTQYVDEFAWGQDFSNGDQTSSYKLSSLRVRPVRAF